MKTTKTALAFQRLSEELSDDSFPSVVGWQQGEDALENLKQSGMRIQKAANQIIDWIENHSPTLVAA